VAEGLIRLSDSETGADMDVSPDLWRG